MDLKKHIKEMPIAGQQLSLKEASLKAVAMNIKILIESKICDGSEACWMAAYDQAQSLANTYRKVLPQYLIPALAGKVSLFSERGAGLLYGSFFSDTLTTVKALAWCNIGVFTFIPESVMTRFSQNLGCSLRELKLADLRVGDAFLTSLASCKAANMLQIFSVRSSTFSDACSQLWLSFPKLQELQLLQCYFFGLESLRVICELKSLEILQVQSEPGIDGKLESLDIVLHPSSLVQLKKIDLDMRKTYPRDVLIRLFDLLRKRPRCSKLELLSLHIQSDTESTSGLERLILDIHDLCPNLRAFFCERHFMFPEDKQYLSNMKRIEQFESSATESWPIPPDSINSIPSVFPNLREFLWESDGDRVKSPLAMDKFLVMRVLKLEFSEFFLLKKFPPKLEEFVFELRTNGSDDQRDKFDQFCVNLCDAAPRLTFLVIMLQGKTIFKVDHARLFLGNLESLETLRLVDNQHTTFNGTRETVKVSHKKLGSFHVFKMGPISAVANWLPNVLNLSINPIGATKPSDLQRVFNCTLPLGTKAYPNIQTLSIDHVFDEQSFVDPVVQVVETPLLVKLQLGSGLAMKLRDYIPLWHHMSTLEITHGHVDTELTQQIFQGMQGLTSLIISTPCTSDLSWIKHKRLAVLDLSLTHNMQQKAPVEDFVLSDSALPSLTEFKLKIAGMIQRVTVTGLPSLLQIELTGAVQTGLLVTKCPVLARLEIKHLKLTFFSLFHLPRLISIVLDCEFSPQFLVLVYEVPDLQLLRTTESMHQFEDAKFIAEACKTASSYLNNHPEALPVVDPEESDNILTQYFQA